MNIDGQYGIIYTNMKTFVATIILLLALAGIGYVWFWYNEGVTHRDIQDSVQSESELTRKTMNEESREIQARIDNRFTKTLKKLDQLEAKLESVDSKLDKILEIAGRPAVDGMEVVK